MPGAPQAHETTKAAVGTPGSDNYVEAKSHVTAQMSIRDTVEHPKFLAMFTDEQKKEIRAVLRAVPPDVDRAYMVSLRDALDRNAKIDFKWREAKPGQDEFAYEVDPQGDTVHFVLVTPDGRYFTGIRGFLRSVGIKNFPKVKPLPDRSSS